MQRKPCMSEYFCHGSLLNRKCNCSEDDVVTYSAHQGLPLLTISSDVPKLFNNTWQGLFNQIRRFEMLSIIEKAYYDVQRNYWFCYGKMPVGERYFALKPIADIPCDVLFLYDGYCEEYRTMKVKMTWNPLLDYLPAFSNRQKINTQERLTDFVLKDIAIDILKFL
jgi:hypothetical protein